MVSSELDDLYHDAILDHRRNPRNTTPLVDPDISAHSVNPFCGDEIHMQINLDDDGRVAEAGLQGEGCSINQATGSMLTETLRGLTIPEIEALSETFRALMRGDTNDESALEALGELRVMAGVRQFPVRIKCALLAWSALADGIKSYRNSR